MVKGGDVEWAGGATRVAKNLGVAQRADVKAIVDDANAETRRAAQPGDRHASSNDILRDPTRLYESAMGNMVADAMRAKYPGRRCRVHELRRAAAGPRLRRRRAPARQPGEITWGEVFAVLPFGNRDDDPHAHRRPAADGVR